MDELAHPLAGCDRPAAGASRSAGDLAAHLVTLLRRSGRFLAWRVVGPLGRPADESLPPDAVAEESLPWGRDVA